jgi:hypothetical protein
MSSYGTRSSMKTCGFVPRIPLSANTFIVLDRLVDAACPTALNFAA